MTLSQALAEFKTRLPLKDADIEHLSPREGIEAMLGFYRDVRCDDCTTDGDTLHVQWGTHDRGIGEQFELEIARQFLVRTDDGERTLWKLSLTFGFDVTNELRAFVQISEWCASPAELELFATFIRESVAFTKVSERRDGMVVLAFERAE